MPITPLHFGILAPVNHLKPGKVSNVSFILANVITDAQNIGLYLAGLPLVDHTWETHSFLGALLVATFVSILGIRLHRPFLPERRWIYGALLGTMTHVILDMLVHPEMHPFYPIEGNPFYAGLLAPLSWALLPLAAWLTVQYVSGIRVKAQTALATLWKRI